MKDLLAPVMRDGVPIIGDAVERRQSPGTNALGSRFFLNALEPGGNLDGSPQDCARAGVAANAMRAAKRGTRGMNRSQVKFNISKTRKVVQSVAPASFRVDWVVEIRRSFRIHTRS